MRELYEGFETNGYIGMGIRSAVAPAIQHEVNRQVTAAVQEPEISRRLREMSMDPVAMDLDSTIAYGRSEREKYGRIMRMAGIEPE
jgi:tripartite-type tricarboxylate transporter receptor subunit TctC